MRSASLLVIAVLAVILAGSLFSPVAAVGGITIVKATTNGDTTTVFHFTVTDAGGTILHEFDLVGGGSESSTGTVEPGVYRVVEEVPPGWGLPLVRCEGLFNLPPDVSTFEYIPGGVIITYYPEDTVGCKFINSPAPPVGGVVMPANTLALAAPWLAVIGIVACVGAVVVVTKKRR